MSVAGISLDRVRCDIQQRVLAFVDSRGASAFFMLLTMFSLFADDARLAAAPKAADDGVAAAFSAAFVLFAIDWLVSTTCVAHAPPRSALLPPARCGSRNARRGARRLRPRYFGSFYFFVELASTLSLLTSVPVVWQARGLRGNRARGR